MKIAIVVLGFRRLESLKRLLDSLNKTQIKKKIDLIISIDGEGPEEVINYINTYSSSKFNLIKKIHKKNLGLRSHVLWSGDLVRNYDGIVILEDDIYVSSDVMKFSSLALKSFKDSKDIAGISLYSPIYNEIAGLPFRPIKNNLDYYLMQVPSSWGQCFTKDQWINFKSWYEKNLSENLRNFISHGLPETVAHWPESSWKKYYYAYLIDKKKFFAYPYTSYSTNFADTGGEHVKFSSDLYQSELGIDRKDFNLEPRSEEVLKYDGYMELSSSFFMKENKKSKVAVNIYGIKNINYLKNYQTCLLLSNNKNLSYINKYSSSLRPVHMNIIKKIRPKLSDEFCIVEIEVNNVNKYLIKSHKIKEFFYNNNMSFTDLVSQLGRKVFKKLW